MLENVLITSAAAAAAARLHGSREIPCGEKPGRRIECICSLVRFNNRQFAPSRVCRL